jgi:hypothetical protein
VRTEFKNGEMIIIHESGHQTKYQAADLANLKVTEQKLLIANQARIDQVDGNIQKIQKSLGAI